MCAVSMVTDHYRDRWPSLFPINPLQPTSPPIDRIIISKEDWENYQKLKKAAEEYDKRNNEPECVKPGVEDWEKKIVEILTMHGILPPEEAKVSEINIPEAKTSKIKTPYPTIKKKDKGKTK